MKEFNNKYCLILGWMRKLGLKGNRLIIYAILYSTSQHRFTNTVDWGFIKDCTGMKPSQAEKILNTFQEKGLIEYDGIYYKTIDLENK